jgi:hypothetical protein
LGKIAESNLPMNYSLVVYLLIMKSIRNRCSELTEVFE